MLRLVLLFIIPLIIGTVFYSCSKERDESKKPTNGEFSNQIVSETEESGSFLEPFLFSFNSSDYFAIEQDLDLLARAFVYLTSDVRLMQLVYSGVENYSEHEILYLRDLEILLNSNGYNFIDLLSNALIEQGATQSEIDRIPVIYKEFSKAGVNYNVYIYIPFTDSVDFTRLPLVTYQIKRPISESDLIVYKRNNENIVNATLDRTIAVLNPTVIFSIESADGVQYAALPWSWCECTRYRIVDGDISSTGNCVNKGDCGRCGRSSFWGECPSDPCAGC